MTRKVDKGISGVNKSEGKFLQKHFANSWKVIQPHSSGISCAEDIIINISNKESLK